MALMLQLCMPDTYSLSNRAVQHHMLPACASHRSRYFLQGAEQRATACHATFHYWTSCAPIHQNGLCKRLCLGRETLCSIKQFKYCLFLCGCFVVFNCLCANRSLSLEASLFQNFGSET
ncbi:hypothetical protein AMECASPLE_020131 [Ameca splendens]|uniref:Uncharacterized protein n=1 Tax=Ameca splendens TaxID=208324 RepID=A0ABV0XGA0_9TELE